jgi:SAM-dependent methyltransferase
LPPKLTWDERYLAGEGTSRDPEPLIKEAATLLTPGHALDLACGTGRNAHHLAERGWSVMAVDSSQVAIDSLKSAIGRLPVQTELADLETGTYSIPPDTYDLVIDCLFLFRPLFPAIRAAIRPGGHFAGVFPMVEEGSDMNPAYLVEPGEILREFEGWQPLTVRESVNTCKSRPRKIGGYLLRKVTR